MHKYIRLVIIILILAMVSYAGCNKMQHVEETTIQNAISKEMTLELDDQKSTDALPIEIIDSSVDVVIYVGKSLWIRQEHAIIEADITKRLLESEDIQVEITESKESVRDWMLKTTGNGAVNVCILYGILPSTIYASGNAQPDGSVVENWIETTDGDTVLNHADYFGYNSSEGTANERGAMQNLMDLPDIEINVYEHNIGMVVTEEGRTLTPSLGDFGSDRPFPLDELDADWFAEKVLATDSQGLLADPIIVRDGDRGRLAIVFHTLYKHDPKGEVAAEIIRYLLTE